MWLGMKMGSPYIYPYDFVRIRGYMRYHMEVNTYMNVRDSIMDLTTPISMDSIEALMSLGITPFDNLSRDPVEAYSYRDILIHKLWGI